MSRQKLERIGNMNEQTRKFADACHENSVAELQLAVTNGPDRIDCREWGITADEWTEAITTALAEKLENLA
jgi:hypothetical protein